MVYTANVHTKENDSTTSVLNLHDSNPNAFSSSPVYPRLQLPDISLLILGVYIKCTLVIFEDCDYLAARSMRQHKLEIPWQQHDSTFLPASLKPYRSRKTRSTVMTPLYAKSLFEILAMTYLLSLQQVLSLQLVGHKSISCLSTFFTKPFYLDDYVWRQIPDIWKYIPWKEMI